MQVFTGGFGSASGGSNATNNGPTECNPQEQQTCRPPAPNCQPKVDTADAANVNDDRKSRDPLVDYGGQETPRESHRAKFSSRKKL